MAGGEEGRTTTMAVPERWPFTGRRVELADAHAGFGEPWSGVVVVGGPGVGRSRFAEELVAEVEAAGRRVARATADRTAAAVPLGALAHLLPAHVVLTAIGDAAPDPVRLLAEARRVLGDGADRLVLLVDDAHLLDAVSLTLVVQLVQEGSAAVVLTVRDDEAQPDALQALWRAERVRRIDLAPLDPAAIGTLLHLGLGGPVEGRTERALREASGGNPLLLRELVRAARTDGVLTEAHGVWSLTGPLPTRHRAAELLHHRVVAHTGPARDVLDLLGAVGPSPLDLLAARFGSAVLEALEADGLVVVRPGADHGAPEAVDLAHPLLAGAVRAATPTLRARSVLRAHADQVEAWPGREPADVLRVASWRLQAGDGVDPVVAGSTATLARHAGDFHLTLRLARAAHAGRPTMRSAVLLGEALYETGAWAEAEAVLAEGDALAGGPEDVLRLVGQRGTNLLFGLLDPDRARQVTEDAAPRLAGEGLGHLRDELVSRRALLQVYDGHPATALAILGDRSSAARELDADGGRAQVFWATPGVPALALAGRTSEAIELAQETYARHAALDGDIAMTSVETHLLTLCLALQEHGSLDDAHALALAGYEASIEAASLPGQTWFALNLARVELVRARPVSGIRWCREAASVAASAGWRGPRAMAMSGLAALSAVSGDLATAHQALGELAGIEGRFGFLLPERCLGPAWALVAQGRRPEAVAALRDGAALAADTGHHTVEAWLSHELARVGDPAEVVARLEELAGTCEGPLVAARAAHVRARVSGSVPDLVAAAEAFEAMGCHLVAAEALQQAADRSRSNGDQRTANGLVARSRQQAGRAEGARSDDLVRADLVVPLTRREREVAVLAATGTSSQEIADRLFLSVRTVSNHLQSAYTKLGVSGRPELAAALSDGDGDDRG